MAARFKMIYLLRRDKKKYMTNQPDIARIENTLGKIAHHLATHNSVQVTVSGGSDSNIIVHIIATYFREHLPKIHFVFCNTGVEYETTLKHLDFMREHYGVEIDEVKGMPIPTAVKTYGIPIICKDLSKLIYQMQHGACPSARKKLETTGKFRSPKMLKIAHYCIDNNIPVSDKCCTKSKKQPGEKHRKSIKADLYISGERRCEGGVRATGHTDCFESAKGRRIDHYMPLWFWDDATKAWYKEHEGIIYSDCYEKWGFNRTGCVGCPYGSKVGQSLKTVREYEPKVFDFCMNLFGQSYWIADKFRLHRQQSFTDKEWAEMGHPLDADKY